MASCFGLLGSVACAFGGEQHAIAFRPRREIDPLQSVERSRKPRRASRRGKDGLPFGDHEERRAGDARDLFLQRGVRHSGRAFRQQCLDIGAVANRDAAGAEKREGGEFSRGRAGRGENGVAVLLLHFSVALRVGFDLLLVEAAVGDSHEMRRRRLRGWRGAGGQHDTVEVALVLKVGGGDKFRVLAARLNGGRHRGQFLHQGLTSQRGHIGINDHGGIVWQQRQHIGREFRGSGPRLHVPPRACAGAHNQGSENNQKFSFHR